MANPIQQGLKLQGMKKAMPVMSAAMANPIQQGLKQQHIFKIKVWVFSRNG